jgi:hypothetical protein
MQASILSLCRRLSRRSKRLKGIIRIRSFYEISLALDRIRRQE